jgi:hypothetical protein
MFLKISTIIPWAKGKAQRRRLLMSRVPWPSTQWI